MNNDLLWNALRAPLFEFNGKSPAVFGGGKYMKPLQFQNPNAHAQFVEISKWSYDATCIATV